MLICTACKNKLNKNGDIYSCPRCKRDFPSFIVNSTEIVDFINIKNSCYCKKIEVDECKINLYEDLKRIEIKKFDFIEASNYKSKTIKEWVGSNNKILDMGCREAPYGRILSENNEVYGLDICAKAMIFGERNGVRDTALNKNYKGLYIADCLHIPIDDGIFDVVVATDILEHIIENKRFISELFRILKDNGKIIVSVPNLTSIYNRISILFGNADGFMPWNIFHEGRLFSDSLSINYPDQDIHVRFFTLNSLKRFVESKGFKVVEYSGIDFNPLFSRVPYLNRVFASLCEGMIILAKKVSN